VVLLSGGPSPSYTTSRDVPRAEVPPAQFDGCEALIDDLSLQHICQRPKIDGLVARNPRVRTVASHGVHAKRWRGTPRIPWLVSQLEGEERDVLGPEVNDPVRGGLQARVVELGELFEQVDSERTGPEVGVEVCPRQEELTRAGVTQD